MKGCVYFLVQGQFGNHLFQYFAAELIRKIYGYECVKPIFEMETDYNIIIDDKKFKEIISAYLANEPLEMDTRRDVILFGFFQRSEIFKAERTYLRSLFQADNTNYISNRVQISNIVKYQTKHTIQPTAKDLTLHLRCGDFWDHVNHRSQIFDPEYIKGIVRSISYEKLYIVASKPTFEWEKEYYQQFEELNPIWISGGLGDDFDFLMKSPKLIISASTLSWMAAYLGNAEEVHIPYNSYYGGIEGYEQHLADCNELCKVYYDVPYWLPSLSK